MDFSTAKIVRPLAAAGRVGATREASRRGSPALRARRESFLEFTHFLSSEMHRALENEGRSTFRQVVFSGCLEENSEGLQRGLR
jgi:hypothetical protein